MSRPRLTKSQRVALLAKPRPPTAPATAADGAVLVLTKWHETIERMRAIACGAVIEEMDEEWLKVAESLMGPQQVQRWDALCRDYTYGKPSAADVRNNALEVLRG